MVSSTEAITNAIISIAAVVTVIAAEKAMKLSFITDVVADHIFIIRRKMI